MATAGTSNKIADGSGRTVNVLTVVIVAPDDSKNGPPDGTKMAKCSLPFLSNRCGRLVYPSNVSVVAPNVKSSITAKSPASVIFAIPLAVTDARFVDH